jgi:hypothetical protein
MKLSTILALILSALSLCIAKAAEETTVLCQQVEATLHTATGDVAMINGVTTDVEPGKERRVEVRRCSRGTLQIAAWAPNASAPGVVLNLANDRILQMFLSGGVFVLETSGSVNRAMILRFDADRVRLVADLETKTDPTIRSDGEHVRIEVKGYRARDQTFVLPIDPYFK